jgi:hypothetical protein
MKVSTYVFLLHGGLTAEPGRNTFQVPYKPVVDLPTDFAGGGALLLVNGGRLTLREDTDTFTITFEPTHFTIHWHSLLHTIGDTDDVSITTDILNTLVASGLAGSTPGGPANGDLEGFYPNPTLDVITAGGTFGDQVTVPRITVDTKGRVTSVTPVAILGASSIPSGPAGGDLTGTYPNPALVALHTGGMIGGSDRHTQIAIDPKGRIVSFAEVPQIVGTTHLVDGAVTNGKLAAMPAHTVKGRPLGAGPGTPVDLTQAQLADLLSGLISGGGGGTPMSGTSVQTTVPASLSSTQLLPANVGRHGATIYNDSPSNMLLKLGPTVAATNFTLRMSAGSYFETPFGWFGEIFAMWEVAATGNARITELSA